MKRTLLSLLVPLIALTGTAQTIGEAFYVYRSNGMINTFFRSEVDSMAYSYYDIDSTYYDEVVTQVIYTPDSIYRFYLAEIDSIGFETPETKYQPGVVKLEGTIRNYIIGSDLLTVFFRSDTPSGILPKIGDKLVTTEMSDVFIAGFSGQVDNIEYRNDSIAVNCISIGLDEVFEVFYCTSGDNYNHSRRNTSRKDVDFSIDDFSPGTFNFSLISSIGQYIKAEKFGISLEGGEPSLDFSITPTYSSRGSLIVHPFWGVVLTLDVSTEHILTEHFSFSGSLSYSPNLDKEVLAYPIPAFPFVQVYGKVGPLFKAELKGSLSETWSQTIRYSFHYENATSPFYFPVLIPHKGNNEYTHEGQRTLEGSLSGGIRGEIGLKIADSRLASAGFGFETGLKLSGDVLITEEMRNTALTNTDLYNKLKKGLDLDFFLDLGVKAKFFSWIETGAKWPIIDKQVNHFNLVPSFTKTLLLRDSDIPSTLTAYTFPKDKVMLPVDLGFRLFKGNETEGLGSTTYHYKEDPQELSITYEDESIVDKYKVYPTVGLFGIEMLATPSAELEAELEPITFGISNVAETSATGIGQIKGFELLDETMSYGLAFQEQGSTTITYCPASSINAIGMFLINFENLKPNTTYNYFAYLEIDGEVYEGTKRLFSTENAREAYGVITENGTVLTYYYDGRKNQRTGKIVGFQSTGWWFNALPDSYKIETVSFDNSFANYRPKTTNSWFKNMENLTSFEHIENLNTTDVTSMSNMFQGCCSLTSLELSSFDTSNLTGLDRMFQGCSSLVTLDLSSFRLNTTNFISISGIFENCTSLRTIYADNWNITYWCDPAPFAGCPNLRGGKGTKLGENIYGYDANGNPLSYYCSPAHAALARIDGGKDSPGLFTEK